MMSRPKMSSVLGYTIVGITTAVDCFLQTTCTRRTLRLCLYTFYSDFTVSETKKTKTYDISKGRYFQVTRFLCRSTDNINLHFSALLDVWHADERDGTSCYNNTYIPLLCYIKIYVHTHTHTHTHTLRVTRAVMLLINPVHTDASGLSLHTLRYYTNTLLQRHEHGVSWRNAHPHACIRCRACFWDISRPPPFENGHHPACDSALSSSKSRIKIIEHKHIPYTRIYIYIYYTPTHVLIRIKHTRVLVCTFKRNIPTRYWPSVIKH